MPVVNLVVHFQPDEIKILRRFAETFKDQRGGAKFTLMAQEFGVERAVMVDLFMRLQSLKLAYGHTNETFRVTPLLIDSLHALDNKPPEDRWKKAKEWFFRRWWSVPVMIAVIGIPAIVGWITMLKTVLNWFGIGEGEKP